jgi:hypothetical protein
MRVLAHRLALGHRRDHWLAEVLRVRAGEADPVDALHGVDRAQELAEPGPHVREQVAPPGVDVLAQERHLPHAVGGEARHLGDDLARPAALLLAAHGGDDAVRAHGVAAHGDLHPRLEVALAACGQVAGEVAPLREASPRDAQAASAEPVGEVRDRPRAERDVDIGVEVEDPVSLRLRVAAADCDHALGIGSLEGGRLREVRGEALVGLLADRARVEDDDVGFVLRDRLAEAERLEQALDPLGVVGIHLTPECRDVVALHGEIVARS